MSESPQSDPADGAQPAELWNAPLPAVAPGPTFIPSAVALGIMLGFWGILTHWIMSLGGAALFVWALSRWMREICSDWRRTDG